MIRELSIRNYALIDTLTIVFQSGFTVFTGETGTGKSILIGAIGLLLGERASVDQIRSGSEEMEIIGFFEFDFLSEILKTKLNDFNISFEDNSLIIRRIIMKNGRNRNFINQVPVPLTTIKTIGDYLVDLHGQHEHQSLLKQETANTIGNCLKEVKLYWQIYQKSYGDYIKAKDSLLSYEKKVQELIQSKEFMEFQYNELSQVPLNKGDEKRLADEYTLLSTVTERLECVSNINQTIEGDESKNSLEHYIACIRRNLKTLEKYDSSTSQWIDDLENSNAFFSELNSFCTSYIETNRTQLNTARIEEINSKIAKIQRMKKKYQCDFTELLRKKETLKQQLDSLENIQMGKAYVEKDAKNTHKQCLIDGKNLSSVRKRALAAFDANISKKMETLGFLGGEWRSRQDTNSELTSNGLETVYFEVCTNPGEPFLPLNKTASGGEISRLMLAIKSVLADNDNIPIVIFDEIDSGIGGVIAKEVARAMCSLSQTHQVICITHLHQIASLADNHFRVFKVVEGKRTKTKIKALSKDEKIEEISRMLGSDSTISKKHAEELLSNKQNTLQ